MNFIESVIIGAILVVCAALGYTLFSAFTAETIELTKSEWTCKESQPYTTFVMSGKVLVPIQNENCVNYVKVKE